jgi:transposase
METKEGYEKALAVKLHAAKFAVSIVNPLWIKNYARAEGKLAKTE